jgi:hypothetical protein
VPQAGRHRLPSVIRVRITAGSVQQTT